MVCSFTQHGAHLASVTKKELYSWLSLWISAAGITQVCGFSLCMSGRAAITKHSNWLAKPQKFVVSQLWRLEVWNQDASRVGSFWGLWGGTCPCCSQSFRNLTCSFACRWWSSHVFTQSSLRVCVSVSKFHLFMRMKTYWIRVHPNDLILTQSSAKTLFPNKVTFTGPGS